MNCANPLPTVVRPLFAFRPPLEGGEEFILLWPFFVSGGRFLDCVVELLSARLEECLVRCIFPESISEFRDILERKGKKTTSTIILRGSERNRGQSKLFDIGSSNKK